MNDINLMYFLVSIIGILLTIAGFFVRTLISRLDSIQGLVANIDKATALLTQEIDSHKRELVHFYEMEKRIDSDIKSIRERIHALANEINKVLLEIEHLKQMEAYYGKRIP